MEITPRSRRAIVLDNLVFAVLFLAALGLLAWLSTRYAVDMDWTAGGRNTLSEASLRLMAQLEGPVTVTAFASEGQAARAPVEDLLARYQRAYPALTFDFINPDLAPELVREQGISREGQLIIGYGGRNEAVREPSEETVTNAIQRLARGGERTVVFLSGHGERRPAGEANHDYQTFTTQLEQRGLALIPLSLATVGSVPRNTSVLVIADPRVALLPGEVALVREWLAGGGNLLWLTEPDGKGGLDAVADDLGLRRLPGTVVDATTQALGISDPTFGLVSAYDPKHPITQDFRLLTVFPHAAALATEPVAGWAAAPFLTTHERSWTETAAIEGEIGYDPATGERRGPLTLGLSLVRPSPTQAPTPDAASGGAPQQRVVVIGDADFLASAYLGNGGNLQLGLSILDWLTHDDRFIPIPPKAAPDRHLALSPPAQLAISAGFLFIVPGLLLAAGFVIGWRRRRR